MLGPEEQNTVRGLDKAYWLLMRIDSTCSGLDTHVAVLGAAGSR